MHEPIFIEPIFQKEIGDCAICCLAMLLGKSYADIVQAAPEHSIVRGMTGKEMISVAEKFGTQLKMYRKYTISEDTGILTVIHQSKKIPWTHAVILIEGCIIDPHAGRVYPKADIYLKTMQFRLGTLLSAWPPFVTQESIDKHEKWESE